MKNNAVTKDLFDPYSNMTLVSNIAQKLITRNIRMATAESCTGGMIGSALTDLPGSSSWYTGGVVAYSNSLKKRLLNVSSQLLDEHGAVSRECVQAMAKGLAELTHANVAIAISGIAGPDGGTKEKPVGTVWMAWQINGRQWTQKNFFKGDRLEIKKASSSHILEFLAGLLQ